MAVSVEMLHTGDAALQREVAALVEHMLADRPGKWLVSIVGSKGSDRWEMRIVGPVHHGKGEAPIRIDTAPRRTKQSSAR